MNFIADVAVQDGSRRFIASHCGNCRQQWPAKYLVPLVGYALYKGKCPVCGEKISLRIPTVELVSGILFGFLFWYYGPTPELALAIVYCCTFIVLTVTDLEKFLLPNIITYPAASFAALAAILLAFLHYRPGWAFYFPATGIMALINNYAVSAVIGGITGFILLLLVWLASRGGTGFGDVKLAALIGLMLGFPMILVALFVGVIAGGLMAAIMLIARIKKRKDPIPFGPFLCLGGFAAMVWGKGLLMWYLNL